MYYIETQGFIVVCIIGVSMCCKTYCSARMLWLNLSFFAYPELVSAENAAPVERAAQSQTAGGGIVAYGAIVEFAAFGVKHLAAFQYAIF